MRIISKRRLREFWVKYPDTKGALASWHFETLKATWASPQQLKAQFKHASILKNSRVVFNIAGNKYRLIVSIDYGRKACFIKFIGTHKEYDQINAEEVG